MVKCAIISDTHANLEALVAVLRDIEQQHVDTIYNLGDAVGYGPNPNQVVTTLQDQCVQNVQGNHDFGAVCDSKDQKNTWSKSAYLPLMWTRKRLTPKNKKYLKELPGSIIVPEAQSALVHGVFSENESISRNIYFKEPVFVNHKGKLRAEPQLTHIPLCLDFLVRNNVKIGFYGHTHDTEFYELFADDFEKPHVVRYYHRGGTRTFPETMKGSIHNLTYLFCNPGSVGQPRDGLGYINGEFVPVARYVLFTLEKDKYCLEFKAVPYPYKITQTKMLQHKSLKHNAKRLEYGR